VSLNKVQKHNYLRNSLSGEAETLQSSSDTFESLWNALTDHYEMKRIIADNHINGLLNMRNITSECSPDLRTMIDKVIKNLRVLSTIDLQLDLLSEMFIVNMLAHRLDNETQKAYELQLRPQIYPKWVELLTFLKSSCLILESIENSRPAIKKPASFR
jgi:hypothetical protein